jgi:hypothetical protein
MLGRFARQYGPRAGLAITTVHPGCELWSPLPAWVPDRSTDDGGSHDVSERDDENGTSPTTTRGIAGHRWRRTVPRLAAATLLMAAGFWPAAPASAAPAPAAPSITFQASTISGFSATSTYTLNRGPQQTASLACAVVRQDGSTTSASCGSVTRSTKESTTRSITLTPLTPGQYAYTVTAVLTDRNRVTGSSTITVVPVRAACTVTGYDVTYDGTTKTATGTCTGIGGGALTGLDLSKTAHTDAGTYSDAWTFTDTTGNYVNPGGTVTSRIGKATAACTVTGYNATYDGATKTATGTCTGISGGALTGLDLSKTAHTDAGTYDDAWTFTDTTDNYVNPGGTVTSRIGQATAACTAPATTSTFDGTARTATGGCTGIGGVALTGLDLSKTAHTDAGTYDDAWTFTDTTGNYVNPGGTVTSRIGQGDSRLHGHRLRRHVRRYGQDRHRRLHRHRRRRAHRPGPQRHHAHRRGTYDDAWTFTTPPATTWTSVAPSRAPSAGPSPRPSAPSPATTSPTPGPRTRLPAAAPASAGSCSPDST